MNVAAQLGHSDPQQSRDGQPDSLTESASRRLTQKDYMNLIDMVQDAFLDHLEEDLESAEVEDSGPNDLNDPDSQLALDKESELTQLVDTYLQATEIRLINCSFDLETAKEFWGRLMTLRGRLTDQAFREVDIERAVFQRAQSTMHTFFDINGMKPITDLSTHQTLLYLFPVLALIPSSVQLVEERNMLIYKFSENANPIIDKVEKVVVLLRIQFPRPLMSGDQHSFHLFRELMNLSSWLELRNPTVAYYIIDKLKSVIAGLHQTAVIHLLPINPSCIDIFLVVDIQHLSCLVRKGFLDLAEHFYKTFRRVADTATFPSHIAVKHKYVRARLLQKCKEFPKALTCAQEAMDQTRDSDEKSEIGKLISQIRADMELYEQESRQDRPLNEEWLEGTNAYLPQDAANQQIAARMNHSKKPKHRRPRRQSPEESSSPSPGNGRSSKGTRAQHYSPNNSSTSSQSHRFSSPSMSSNDDFSEEAQELTSHDTLRLKEMIENISFLDDEENEDAAEQTYFCESESDSSEDEDLDLYSESQQNSFAVENPEDERDWFEKSEERIMLQEPDDDINEEVHISEEQRQAFEKNLGKIQGFYSELHTDFGYLKNLMDQQPQKYKHCQLKIESSHRAVAKVMTPNSKFSEILITGRSKCGRTYTDDEIVVEVLAEPGQNNGLENIGTNIDFHQYNVESMAHGQVIGLLKRNRYPGVECPVLTCTIDEIEGHLMRPLCKTVPKIHVLHDSVMKHYPALKRNRVEVKRITEDGSVEHDRYENINPSKRGQYVFRVAIFSWKSGSVYPVGAILDFCISGNNYAGGLEVLCLQQSVPKTYPKAVVEDTKALLLDFPSRSVRRDLTQQVVFTIDPPNSKDLDDALSIWKKGNHYIVGVHIADVAAVVKKGSAIDEEAKRRAVTFYPLGRKPRTMLPEPLSHGRCSLLEGQERFALSIFFKFNDRLHSVQSEESWVEKTIIKSKRQFTYTEVQNIINQKNDANADSTICKSITKLHQIACHLRSARLKDSKLFIPFEDPRLDDLDKIKDSIEAHALVEELMVLANAHIAQRLRRKFPNLMILRCHQRPTYEELAEWRDREGNLSNLVLNLQGKKTSPANELSVQAGLNGRILGFQNTHLIVQSAVWHCLDRALENGDLEKARKIAFTDAVHPLQCLANQHWLDMMETAEYKCSEGLNGLDHYHFGLDLAYYTHFTSPIRRYADLHVHRLLHADLDGKVPQCTPQEIADLCRHINSVTSRQRAFGRGCLQLKIAETLQGHPLEFRTYVDRVNSEQLTLCVPSFLKISSRRQELPFSVLGITSQPEVETITAQKKSRVTVEWNKKVFNHTGYCPREFKLTRENSERRDKRVTAPLILDLNDHQLSLLVKQTDWAQMLHALMNNSSACQMPNKVEVQKTHVDYISSEKGDGTIFTRPCRFRMVYSPGQVIKVQISAVPQKGMPEPRIELLHLTRNLSICMKHVEDPVSVLSRHSGRATRDENFTCYKDYKKAWMPLLEMEAALGAGSSEGSFVIENVEVTLKQDSSNKGILGFFTLPASFCFDRCIEFGGKSSSSIREDEDDTYKGHNSCPLDYLCLRYSTKCDMPTSSRVECSELKMVVDDSYTWIGHGAIMAANVKNVKKKGEGDGFVSVTFRLNDFNTPPPAQVLEKVTLEVLSKSEVDRRAQQMLQQLGHAKGCDLAKIIAFGSKLPKLDKYHAGCGKKVHKEVGIKGLPKNNSAQYKAIEMALTNSLCLIQGPPGTGKTYTGIKLVYLFCGINRTLEANGQGKKTLLFCGPSNKSVDLVARLLKQKLGAECPKIVRVYGTAIQTHDYPGPRSVLMQTRGSRDAKSDPELQDITLHHLIRQEGKPHAEAIALFEKYFELCRTRPDVHTLSNHSVRKYRKLLFKANVEELRNYEVILTTCAVGGNRIITEAAEDRIYQVIIDECAMSPEPHSMVPIIANKAKQVVLIGDHKQLRPIIKCRAAADLGLDQSLFERLFEKFPSNRVFLDTQYRMHPSICQFPCDEFYEGFLRTGPSRLWEGEPLPFWPADPFKPNNVHLKRFPHLLIDVRGEEETLTVTTEEGNERSKSNAKEAEKVIEIFGFLKQQRTTSRAVNPEDEDIKTNSITVLTQYNAQRHLIEQELMKRCEDRTQNVFDRYDKNKIKVSTVVSSQGGEWDYVILSTVRSLPSYKIEPRPTLGWCRQNMGFITDRNQVNVALTRARRGIIIVGNVELLRCDQVWSDLIDMYEERGCIVEAADFPPKQILQHKHYKRYHGNATSDWKTA